MTNRIRFVALVVGALVANAVGLATAADGLSSATQPAAGGTTRPASTPASGPATRPVDARAVAELISKLANESFAVREDATKKLIEMGEGVRPLLEEALKQKDLDLEAVTRMKTVLAKTSKAPKEDKTATDQATGITVSIDDSGTAVSASQNGKMLWQCRRTGAAGTSLKILSGQVIVSPGNWVIDLATGRTMSVGP
jgi:hypothetical protein